MLRAGGLGGNPSADVATQARPTAALSADELAALDGMPALDMAVFQADA